MLAKYPQMIEFLEIPQLLNNCIRTFYYDDALKICDFITKFCTRYKNMAPIFEVFTYYRAVLLVSHIFTIKCQ